MADLSLGWQLLVDTPARAFGFQRTPPYMHTEMIELLAPFRDGQALVSKSSVQLNGLRAIPEIGVMILEPRPSRVDTRLADYEFPTTGATDWTEGNDSTTGKISLEMTNATADHTFDIRTVTLLPVNASFYTRIKRGQAVNGATVSANTYYTIMVVGEDTPPGNDVGATPFRLILQDGKPPFLQQGVDNNTGDWYWGGYGENGVMGTVSDSSQLFEEQNRVIVVEWFVFPDQNALIVRLAGGKDTLVFKPENIQPDTTTGLTYKNIGNVSVLAGKIRLYGQNGTAGFQYLPVEFAPNGFFISAEVPLPFVYQGNGGVYLPGASFPDGSGFTWTISQTDYTGTRVKYTLLVTGTDDPDATSVSVSPIITSIQMRIPPVFDYTATIGVTRDVSSMIGRIEERQWYDIDTGIVRTQVGLTFSNAYGDFTGADGTHRAVQYSRWLNVRNAYGQMQPLSDPITFLTGWAGHESAVWKADPRREFDLILDDRWWPMTRQQCGALPFADLWCGKAVWRFLLNMAGVRDEDIADTFKTCDFGPLPEGCNHYKLPGGTYTTPKMSFSPEQTFLSAMEEVSDMFNAVLFWNSQGVFDGFEYDPGIYQTPFKGTFGVTDSGNPLNSDFLTALWRQINFRVNTKDRRTSVAAIGKNPSTNSLQMTNLSADDVIPGFTANIHGFREPYIKASNRFSDPVFSDVYAKKMLQKRMLPNLFAEFSACFLPNLFAMDRYGVVLNTDDIVGGTQLVCEEIRSVYDVSNPDDFGSTIDGRWVGNF
ncbi:hypothetical protein CCAX7_14460 [Capsulimonas corticalis]|uniref:Uncharacterized protein n=1 Tax=Capsulimonas corticalis TaxID=2219043 RepID=A0A402CZL9_9BACT|nr:hypothetical protein [Capsulimonas corticalis]BDI29395.1 hypothetical protein CCAX7_14460 [Capsulimonas corticalis]